ncbi:hypothetical protein RHS02_06272, partial [Rhizoctonia solani]
MIVTDDLQRAEDLHEILGPGTEVRSGEPSTYDSFSPPQAITEREVRYGSDLLSFLPPTIPLDNTNPTHTVICHHKPSIWTVVALGGTADTPRPPKAGPGSPTVLRREPTLFMYTYT